MSSVFSRKITMSTFSGCFTGDGTPCEPAHRAQAHVEVEDLAQRDVEAADAAADRRGERALDADEVAPGTSSTVSSGSQSPVCVERLLAGEHLLPLDRLAVLGRGRVEHELGGGPDVDAGAVALDEGDDRLVGDVEADRRRSCVILSAMARIYAGASAAVSGRAGGVRRCAPRPGPGRAGRRCRGSRSTG